MTLLICLNDNRCSPHIAAASANVPRKPSEALSNILTILIRECTENVRSIHRIPSIHTMNNSEAKKLNAVLAGLQRELNRHDRLSAAALGVGSAEDLQVLRMLLSEGPLRVGALAAQRSSSVATASARLDRLERRGYVVRERRPNDRRAVVAVLTDTGEKIAKLSRAQRTGSLRSLHDDVPVDQLAVVIDALTTGLESVRKPINQSPE